MGRIFSTTYRAFMVAFSIAALVLSFMSATSCSFLSFDHQYGSQNRWLQDGTLASLGEETDTLISQMNDEEANAADPEDEELVPVSVTEEDMAAKYDPDLDGLEEYPETDPDYSGMTETVPTQEAGEMFGEGPDEAMEETIAPEGGYTPPPEENSVTGGPLTDGLDPLSGMGDSVDVPDSITDAIAEGALAFAPKESGSTVPPPSPSDILVPVPKPPTGSSGTSAKEPTPSFGADWADSISTATAPTEPALVVSGDAGLFCNGETSFDIRSVWGGSVDKTIEDLETEIDTESSDNQSEEIARNAVLASAVFGTLITFIAILESTIGWRMCFERLIIGIIAMCALICQSVTFLFFNSQRYCDGDIVHEILNQEPCVIGRGGVYSAVSIALYAVIMIMACRLPKDDPYGICCNKKGSSTGGSSPLTQDDEGTSNGRSWVSKERKGASEEEHEGDNEII